jgi:chlorobactene glucosyltransferase
MLFSWRRMAGLALLALPLGLRAERSYRALPRLARTRIDAPLPMLSIIVPARNEAANLPDLLSSLQKLSYPGVYEVIVVDDSSSDRTAEVAATYGARVIRLDRLPAGWRGKPHASHQGALAARGAWLLFTDADTLHNPAGPAQAVAHAIHNGLDGLSLFLRQDCRSRVERLPLMAAFAGLFAGIGPASSLLNGQFILLRRKVYQDSGGFAAVRYETQDDLALGNRLDQLGYHVPMMRGEEAGSVHMYAGAVQVWHGMSRLGSNTLHWSGFGAVLTGLFISALMSPLIVAIGVLGGRLDRKWLLAAYPSAVLSMVTWARRFGSSGSALLAPFGALWVQAAATWGLVSRLLGRNLHWKGRPVN